MAMYSISGFGYDSCVGYDSYEPSAICGPKKRQQRKEKRKGVNCKGSKLKKIALAVPRNAFLSLVRLNVHKFALRLYSKMQNPAQEIKLMEKWCKLGGDASKLRSAVNKAVAKYKRKHPGRKIGDPTGTTEAIIASATPIIIAMLEFLKKPGEKTDFTKPETETSETPETPQTETVEGIGAMNPYLLAGAVGVGVYFLTKKRYI